MRTSLPRGIERAATAITFLSLVGGLCILWLTGVTGRGHLVANLLGTYFILWGLALLVVKASRAEMTMRFVLSTTALGVVLLCLEATAAIGGIDYRVVFGLEMRQARWQLPQRSFDPELGWVYKPYARFSGAAQGSLSSKLCLDTPPYRYDVRFDRHGFRNDVDLDAADIAVIGDSFIEATETASDRIITRVLAGLTESTVVNLGRGSYGPQQGLVVLKRYALPLRPQVVVWAFYEGNDLHDVANYEAMMSSLERGEVGVRPSVYERSFVGGALGALIRLAEGCTPYRAQWLSSGTFRTSEGQNVPMYFLVHGEPAEHARALEKIREVLEHASELTQRQGVALAVAFIPTGFRVYKDTLQCSDDSNCTGRVLSDLPQRFAKVVAAASDKIRYIDLTPTFVAEAKKGRLLYLPDDAHWSAEGHRVAAEAIAGAIAGFLRRRQP